MADRAPPPRDGSTPLQGWAANAARLYHGSRQPRWAMASQLVVSGANFATTIIVLRTIGFEGFGQFSLCFLLIMVARNFLCGVVLDPMAAIAPKLRPTSIARYRSFLGLTVLGFAVLSTAILTALTLPLAYVLNAPWLPALALGLGLANAFSCIADYASRYHFVYQHPVRAFVVDASRYGVQVLCVLGLAASGADWLTPASVLYALACGSVFGAIIGLVSQGRFRWSRRLSHAVWPRHRNFVRWMSVSISIETVQSLAPMFIGVALLGEAALGVVRSVQQMTNILNLPTNALLQVLPAKAAAIYAGKGVLALRHTLRSATNWIVLYFAAIAALLFGFGVALAQVIFGEVPPDFAAILSLYVVANFFFSIRMILGIMFLSMERPRVVVKINAVGAVIAILVPVSALVLGPEAIALSATLSMLGMVVASVIVARRSVRHG